MKAGKDQIEIRIPADLSVRLRHTLTGRIEEETVVFGLASHSILNGKVLILVKDILPLPDEAYIYSKYHGAKWSGQSMISILNAGLDRDCGLIIFHSHGEIDRVGLSGDDRRSAQQLLPTFQNVIPHRPHASIVFGKDCAAGMVLLPEQEKYSEKVRVRWIGDVLSDWESARKEVVKTIEKIYRSQEAVIGYIGQERLRSATVAVVGLGGGGSHVIQQLAHVGCGEIIGIDKDHIEERNHSRLVGATLKDVSAKSLKIDIMARLVKGINPKIKYTGVPYFIPEAPAIAALKEADIVVGCLDSRQSRVQLQDLASRYLIPYVDIGLSIPPHKGEVPITIGGHVISSIPGKFCLWCCDYLNEYRLSQEKDPQGYFKGGVERAQVVTFNGILASQAVNEVLQLLTGFAPVGEELSFKKLDGLEGTLQNWVFDRKESCPTCLNVLGRGDVVWKN